MVPAPAAAKAFDVSSPMPVAGLVLACCASTLEEILGHTPAGYQHRLAIQSKLRASGEIAGYVEAR